MAMAVREASGCTGNVPRLGGNLNPQRRGQSDHLGVAGVVLPVLDPVNRIDAQAGSARDARNGSAAAVELDDDNFQRIRDFGHEGTIGKLALPRKAFLPAAWEDDRRVDTPSSLARTLARNLDALMKAHADMRSQAAVARRAGIDQRTVGRILHTKHAPTLQQIDKLASAFGMPAWQLLLPGFDPSDPPSRVLTAAQNDAWLTVRVAAETLAKYAP